MITLTLRKVGNHYYPCIIHECFEEIQLDPKLERVLDLLKQSDINVTFYGQYGVVPNTMVLQFNDEDILRYLTTADDFDIRFYINNHEFFISSYLYTLLEEQFNFNFHKTLYRIEIW